MRVLIAAAIFGISFGNYGCSNEAKFAGRPMAATEAPAAAEAPASTAASPEAAIQTTADANPSGVTTTGATITTTTGTTTTTTAGVTGNTGGATTTGTTTGTTAVVSSPWLDVTAVGPNLTLQDTRTGLKWTNRRPDATWQGAINYCSALNYNGVTGWRLPTLYEFSDAANISKIADAVRTNWLTAADMNLAMWSATPAEACCAYYPGFTSANSGQKTYSLPVVCVQ